MDRSGRHHPGRRGHAPGDPQLRFLVPRRDVLRVRRHVERAVGQHFIPHAVEQASPSRRRHRARGDGRVQLHRDDHKRLAHRPLRPAQAPADLLRVPGHQPAVPAVRARHDDDRRVRDPVRARLHRDRPADRRPGRGPVRRPQRRGGVRLDLCRAHARCGDRGVGRRGRPRERRRLRGRVRRRGLDRDRRRLRGADDPRREPASAALQAA